MIGVDNIICRLMLLMVVLLLMLLLTFWLPLLLAVMLMLYVQPMAAVELLLLIWSLLRPSSMGVVSASQLELKAVLLSFIWENHGKEADDFAAFSCFLTFRTLLDFVFPWLMFVVVVMGSLLFRKCLSGQLCATEVPLQLLSHWLLSGFQQLW